MYALRDDEAALDAVQDAMLKLSVSYGDHPADEYPMLFQRILRNVILDALRRRKVRDTWVSLFSTMARDGEDVTDPLEHLESEPDGFGGQSPESLHERARTIEAIEQALSRLPQRQREAFVMRYWEELDIAETAAAMGCSEGSVKTHCSRAVKSLAAVLKAKGITL